jgi:hypothetical protein
MSFVGAVDNSIWVVRLPFNPGSHNVQMYCLKAAESGSRV